MLEELIKDKIYYKIFDYEYKNSTHDYNIYDFEDETKIEQVKNNIKLVLRDYNVKNILMLKQIHGNKIISIDDLNFDFKNWPEADATLSTQKKIILAIRTADCVPILFASDDGEIIGAAHCGWRSAKLDIIEALVNKMRHKGALGLVAIIGPSITQKSYEVSKEFYTQFTDNNTEYKYFFIPSLKHNHYMFDLPAFIMLKLERVNVKIIKHINEDTYLLTNKYPSYRRATHMGEYCTQRILSTIIMK